jgi:hypothetical protein
MLMLSKSLYGRPIMSLRSESNIGVATEPIINPHNLKILGWWCKSPGSGKQQVLLAENVRELMPGGLAVNDESALSTADELVRHREILDIRFQLTDKLVKTKRQKLGKVSDFTYDESMFIQKLYVSRSLTKIFSSEDTLIIDRRQILEVTDNYILVEDADIKVTEEELAPAAAPVTS